MKEVVGPVGVDRNLRNITFGNGERVIYYDISKAMEIGETATSIVGSFKRDDVRVRRQIASKYGRRRKQRINQILHSVSREIVREAKEGKQVIIFEQITGIRSLYRRGSFQGRSFRRRMNSAPFYEIKRQIEYKASWEGVPSLTLARSEAKGTTMDCARCGERLQEPARGDAEHYRQLWCDACKKWMDRDLVAVLNISRRGWVRFAHSKGEAGEAMRGNPEHERNPVILRVDASKPGLSYPEWTRQNPKES